MRAFRRLTAALAALCLFALPVAAQSPAPAPAGPPFELKQVGPGVYAAIGGPMAGSNAGFVVGDDGVLVVDTFFFPEAAKALLAAIRKTTDKPIRYVVNTHYHIDHVSGDAVFKAAGATIIAHKNVPGWIHSENLHLLGANLTPAMKAQIDGLIPPDQTIDKTTVITLGKRRIELHPMAGHTGGDLVVGVLDAHVMFTGDIVWNHTGPTTIDGTISKWMAEVAQLEKLPDTTFVPGHGDVATAKDLDDLRALFADLISVTADARKAGLSGDALAAVAAPKLAALHQAWPRLDRNAPFLVKEMDQELAGTKRVPVPAG
ncbi:MAG TPA: MBL fold metallo-hydrolase [Caulobacteraceae bacterium]|jgi:glyoxylase-like metal-dependent hydrolase (beta-lactamase superfamily II)